MKRVFRTHKLNQVKKGINQIDKLFSVLLSLWLTDCYASLSFFNSYQHSLVSQTSSVLLKETDHKQQDCINRMMTVCIRIMMTMLLTVTLGFV